jgi:multisubunit Na+/H+ antiporter MnhB subunit
MLATASVTTAASLLLDLLVVGTLLWVALRAVLEPDLFVATVFFIVFGLVMALAWARLSAPDIAIAEVAIGAGITGALLLDAVAQVRRRTPPSQGVDGDAVQAPPPRRVGARAWLAGAAFAVAGVLSLVVLTFGVGGGAGWGSGTAAASMPSLVEEAIGRSGVAHPITAVLLAFRAYDTMLEVAVLLAAVVPVLALAPDASLVAPSASQPEPVLSPFTRLLVPLAVIVAGYTLWIGSYEPGGAFQAGAILAAAVVLLRLANRVGSVPLALPLLRVALVGGLALFTGVAAGTALAGGGMLALAEATAGAIILTIEVALTVSIAATLCAMFPGTVSGTASVLPATSPSPASPASSAPTEAP